MDVGLQINCPRCRKEITLPGRLQTVATKNRSRKNTPAGIALEILGFFLLMFYPIGTIIGVPVIYAGWRKSNYWSCSNCGHPLKSKEARSCSHCRAVLTLS